MSGDFWDNGIGFFIQLAAFFAALFFIPWVLHKIGLNDIGIIVSVVLFFAGYILGAIAQGKKDNKKYDTK